MTDYGIAPYFHLGLIIFLIIIMTSFWIYERRYDSKKTVIGRPPRKDIRKWDSETNYKLK